MSDRQRLVDQLLLHEGLRCKPYTDTVGKITIGVGRNLTDVGISKREALDLLDHDLDAAIADLASAFPWFLELDAVRQRVLVDMRVNLGLTRLRGFVNMLQAVEQGDYLTASEHMRASRWAQQVKFRADRLANMMASGLDEL